MLVLLVAIIELKHGQKTCGRETKVDVTETGLLMRMSDVKDEIQ